MRSTPKCNAFRIDEFNDVARNCSLKFSVGPSITINAKLFADKELCRYAVDEALRRHIRKETDRNFISNPRIIVDDAYQSPNFGTVVDQFQFTLDDLGLNLAALIFRTGTSIDNSGNRWRGFYR